MFNNNNTKQCNHKDHYNQKLGNSKPYLLLHRLRKMMMISMNEEAIIINASNVKSTLSISTMINIVKINNVRLILIKVEELLHHHQKVQELHLVHQIKILQRGSFVLIVVNYLMHLVNANIALNDLLLENQDQEQLE